MSVLYRIRYHYGHKDAQEIVLDAHGVRELESAIEEHRQNGFRDGETLTKNFRITELGEKWQPVEAAYERLRKRGNGVDY